MKRIRLFCTLLLLMSVLCMCIVACDGDVEELPLPAGSIMLSDIEKMQIVFDEDGGEDYQVLAESVRDAIKDATGISLQVYPDTSCVAGEYEIILGPCEGRVSENMVGVLRANDYFCAVDNKVITLGAITSEALSQAIDHFVTNAVTAYKENDRDLFCTKEAITLSSMGTYAVNTLTVGGTSITDYVIVYPKEELNFEGEYAEAVAAKIEEISGYRIPVCDDTQEWDATHELHIGLTSGDDEFAATLSLEPHEYVIEKVENKVILASSTKSGYAAASAALLAMMSEDEAINQTLAIDLHEKVTATGNDLSVKVMSYNIYYGRLNETRMSHVIEMIEKHNPGVIGVQEATPEWKVYLTEHLGDIYGIIGEGRNGSSGDGEQNLILYCKEQFNLIDSGTLWLSYMPEYPSKFSESSLNRIVTYVVLERKCDGKQFVHLNTHLDHTSDVARVKQVGVLLNIAGEYKDFPCVITGDFNDLKNSSPIQTIIEGGFSDTADIAIDSVTGNTFGDEKVIDFCFVTPEKVKVLSYQVDTFKYNAKEKDPSDHAPVIVDLLIR